MSVAEDPSIHPLTLLAAIQARTYRVHELRVAGDDATRLKRMGVCEGRLVQVLQGGDPLILLVAGARVAISRQLAGLVVLDPADLDSPAA